MGKHWIKIPLTTIELFKGKIDTVWRIATKTWGPKPVPAWLSQILDKIKDLKT